MTADFTLTLTSSDSSGFLNFRAEVACRGFSGRTAFSYSERDLAAFLAEARAVHLGTQNSAQMIGGWEDASERLRLRLTPAGPFGHFQASVRIADTGPRPDQWQRVDTEFVCPPEALAGFLTAIQRLAADRTPGSATLTGDPDAIA